MNFGLFFFYVFSFAGSFTIRNNAVLQYRIVLRNYIRGLRKGARKIGVRKEVVRCVDWYGFYIIKTI